MRINEAEGAGIIIIIISAKGVTLEGRHVLEELAEEIAEWLRQPAPGALLGEL